MKTEIDFQAYSREMLEAAGSPRITIQFEQVHLVFLIGQLQLALRNPKNVGPSAMITREIVEQLSVFFDGEIRKVIEAGSDPENDLPWEDLS